MSALVHDNIECLPLIHGRLAFALESRRRMLETRYDVIAVELPPSLETMFRQGLDTLPAASVVLYRETPEFLDERAPYFYVPVQPADGIVEALRVARGERIPVAFIDAEVDDFAAEGLRLPDPHAVTNLGLEAYYEACLPALEGHRRGRHDELRESHMAARVGELAAGADRVLFICGMAHWRGVKHHLQAGSGRVHPGDGVPPEQVSLMVPELRSLPFIMGEAPYLVARYEEHRSGFELDDYDPVAALKQMLLDARDLHAERFSGSLETPDPQALRTVLDYLRKLTVRKQMLIPDSYSLIVAARGVVGNDYALALLDVAHGYPWNPSPKADEGAPPQEDAADEPAPWEHDATAFEREGG